MEKKHKQFPGKMDSANKRSYRKGYKIAKHGNVQQGYRKLKHVKLFENFDSQTPEMEGVIADAINNIFPNREVAMREYKKDSDAFYGEIIAQVKSDTGMTDESTITDALDNWLTTNESKWFVAQEGEERFKFQAKDMDEAKEYASKTWNAEVIGEVDEEMEFEDTPMDESDRIITFSVDDDKLDQLLHSKFRSRLDYKDIKGDSYYVLNQRDFDYFIDLADSSGFDVDHDDSESSVLNVIEPTDESVNDNLMNEGSYTDFLTSHCNDLKKAVTQIKEIGAVYDDKIEDRAGQIEKAMSVYDEEVGNQIDSWTGGYVSTDKIAKFAIENQDKNGTEPGMVLDAISKFHEIITK